jgi:hypothetical protein
MKIRNGWVSNSSTTSFVVAGAEISDMPEVPNWARADEEEIQRFEDYFTPELVEKVKAKGSDTIGEFIEDFGLEAFGSDEGEFFIGEYPEPRDDQTWGDYKREVFKKVSKVVKHPGQVAIHAGSYYS